MTQQHPSSHTQLPDSLTELLYSSVTIYRDDIGVPHIRTENRHDAFVMQGYTHASDRMWQMDSARMQMLGRWSEWTGPSGIAADTLARRLGGERASRRDYEALNTATQAMLRAYADGINAYLESKPELSFEYGLLEWTPEIWEPWHSVAVMRQRGYLMGSIWFKLWRAAAIGIVPDEALSSLRYHDDEGTDRIIYPAGVDRTRYKATLEELQPSLAALAALGSNDSTDGGSNNWVVSGAKTASTLPLIAGDPHRSYEMPAMYAQMHLACDEFDAIGFTVPGVPAFPHFAHNGSVAWCVTHAFADIHDLYIERFNPEAPDTYLFRDEWHNTTKWTESITVRGETTPHTIDIIETLHGPIIAGDPTSGHALSLKSVQFFDTDLSLDALLPQLTANNIETLYEASRDRWGVIDHNLLTADIAGNIGHRVRALVPKRGVENGWLPVPGWTGDHEWQGYIEFDDMPHTINPADDQLVTANNRVTDRIELTGDHFCTDAHPPHRAKRITDLLNARSDFEPADMIDIHKDVYSGPASQIQNALATLTLEVGSAAARARDSIIAWDAHMDTDSQAAALYSRFRWALAANLVQRSGLHKVREHSFQRILDQLIPENHMWWMIPSLLRERSEWVLGGSTWDAVLTETLAQVNAEEPSTWGEVHTVKVKHPLATTFPEHFDVLNPSAPGVAGDNECVFANGSLWQSGLANVYGAVARYVFVPGDWNRSSWVTMSGSNGDPTSNNYMSQNSAWAEGDLYPMLYSWDLIEAASRETITFIPQR